MKEIKELLEDYEQAPSADVWNRINAQLDKEMPLARANRKAVWKWAAVAALVIALGGAVTFGLLRHHAQEPKQIAQEETVVTVNEEVVNEESVAQEETAVEVPSEVSAPSASAQPTHPSADSPSKESSAAQSKTVSPKTNVRQVVLPANSTLAKQLAADPVLKNLSDESVEWSKPAHLSIPNLFTPNDDGVNDLFVIEGLDQYSSPRLVVRDKNNRVVYQSNDYRNEWGGENCPEGVYNYEFTFLYNGIESQATGRVRIIRS